MATLDKLNADQFDDVYRTFLANDDQTLQADDWRALFAPRGGPMADYCGYVLTDRGRIVGMLGMLFSERTVRGQSRSFCNLHSWIVDEDHRGHSLLLMRPALKLTDCTLTDFTPTSDVCRISKRLGFVPLESALRILLPAAGARRDSSGVEFVDDVDEISQRLNDDDAQILSKHRLPHLRHLLVRSGSDDCYIVFSRVERHIFPYCHIHYVSNKPLFQRESASIRRHLLKTTGGRFAAIDARTVRGLKFPLSFVLPMQSQQLYRPANVEPADVDTLFSEVSFLNLTTFPSLRYTLRRMRQFSPSGWRKQRASLQPG